MANRDKTKKQLERLLDKKQNAPERLAGRLGTVIEGRRLVMVVGRPRYVYVRINGNTGELVEAINAGSVGNDYDAHVILERSGEERTYKCTGYDTSSANFTQSSSSVGAHGSQHRFGPGNRGNDPVWTYKDQLMPFLVRPAGSSNPLSVVVEPDFYSWHDEIYLASGTTMDLTNAIPRAGEARFVTVAIDGDTGCPYLISGSVYSWAYPPADYLDYIPMPAPSTGFPLKAIRLIGGTAQVSWDDMTWDLRTLVGSAYGSTPVEHALSPDGGLHTGSVDVSWLTGAGDEVLLGGLLGLVTPVLLGTNLTLVTGTLNATGGGGTPSDNVPFPVGTGSAGVSSEYARGDHKHSFNVIAPLVYSELTGTLSLPVSGVETEFLNGLGNWATPAGSGGGDHDHGVARVSGSAGQATFTLPDYAHMLEFVSVGGLLLDPADIELNLDGDELTITPPLAAPAVLQVNYMVRST